MAKKGKGLIRSAARKGVRSGKTKPSERGRRPAEPSVCERCGAVFVRRVWRHRDAEKTAVLARAHWVVCPACEQTGNAECFGRVLVRGEAPRVPDDAIRRRIDNVATRAAYTQPERRVVSVERQGDVLEVLTTSQKLAHRIVHELRKLLGGKPIYRWSDDRTLLATLELPPSPRRGVRR
jgi:hypothetical protein